MGSWESPLEATNTSLNNAVSSLDDCSNISSLDDDSLGAVFQHFSLSFRIRVISLVCKKWQRVQLEHPLRPHHLAMQPTHFCAALRAGHARDASRLQTMEVYGEHGKGLEAYDSGAHGGALHQLLLHLAGNAPALCSLSVTGPAVRDHPRLRVLYRYLPLVGALGRLECLLLQDWQYAWHSIPDFALLAGLQNLKVLSLQRISGAESHVYRSMTAEEYAEHVGEASQPLPHDYIVHASSQLQKAICALPQLTRLLVDEVDLFARCFMVQFPVDDLSNLTNLRSLTCHSDDLSGGNAAVPLSAQMTQLTSLSVPWVEGFPMLDILASLENLKDLDITDCVLTGAPLAICTAAELTKLTVKAFPHLDGWDAYLPIEALSSLRELAIHAHYSANFVFPSWPASLRQLTQLTGLTLLNSTWSDRDTLDCVNGVKMNKMCVMDGLCNLPRHLLGMESLVEVELTGRISHVAFWCQHYLEALFSLPWLAKLQAGWEDGKVDYAYSIDGLRGLCCQAKCVLIRKGVRVNYSLLNNCMPCHDGPREFWQVGRVVFTVEESTL